MTSAEVMNWIGRLFGLPEGAVTITMTKDEIPGWDSMGLLTLMSGLFEEFQLDISDADLLSLRSAKDVLDLLRRNGLVTE